MGQRVPADRSLLGEGAIGSTPILHSVPLGCWLSTDGSEIVGAALSEPSGFHGFHVINVRTGETKDVPLPEYSWLKSIDCSPVTGMILAVVTNSDKYQIKTFKPDGSAHRTLAEEKEEIPSAQWSPLGDAVYYLHGRGSTKGLSKINVTGREIQSQLLAEGLQAGELFSVSSNGSRLAYTRQLSYANLWRLVLTTTAGPGKAVLSSLTSGTSYHGRPRFSPDGRWIVFESGANESEKIF